MAVLEARLTLSERPAIRDHLHGAWWPRSADITAELAPLLRAVAGRMRVVVGVALNRNEWPGAPLVLPSMSLGRTKVSWYALVEPHLIVLRADQLRRFALLIVPPNTQEDIALTAMLMASRPGNILTTTDVLAHAHATGATPAKA